MIYTLYIKDDEDTIIDTVTFDSVNSFGETYSSSVPQSPVENGYNVSDTTNLSNPVFTIGGVITDSKFRVDGHLIVYTGVGFEKTSPTTLKTINDDEGARLVREKLISIWEQSIPVGIIESDDINNPVGSEIRDIFPCFINNLSFSKNDSSEALFPSITLERVRYTSVKIANVDNAAPELIPLAKKENVGTSGSVTTDTKVDKDEGKKLVPDLNETKKPNTPTTKTPEQIAAEKSQLAKQANLHCYNKQIEANKSYSRAEMQSCVANYVKNMGG